MGNWKQFCHLPIRQSIAPSLENIRKISKHLLLYSILLVVLEASEANEAIELRFLRVGENSFAYKIES